MSSCSKPPKLDRHQSANLSHRFLRSLLHLSPTKGTTMRERMSLKCHFGKQKQIVRPKNFEHNQCTASTGFAFLNVRCLIPPLTCPSGHLKSEEAFKPTFRSFLNLLRLRYSQEARADSCTRWRTSPGRVRSTSCCVLATQHLLPCDRTRSTRRPT